jgi:pimeloyl-ACP methyl ester carboxylesterase
LKDGRVLVGSLGEIHQIIEPPEERNKPRGKTIVVIDDGLRFTYVPKYKVVNASPEAGEQLQTYKIHQRYTGGGTAIKVLGDYNFSNSFDQFGRRSVSLSAPGGVEMMVQAITEINPHYVKIEGLRRTWDMRVATGAIPRNVLTPIILNQIDAPKNIEQRLGLIRFYIQANKYKEAANEAAAFLQEFQNDPELKNQTSTRDQLTNSLQMLRQRETRQRLEELELRFQAGQYELVYNLLQTFETQNVAGDILQGARRLMRRYEDLQRRRETFIREMDSLIEKIEVDEPSKKKLASIRDEIAAELNFNTIERISLFELHRTNANLENSQKLAYAISGWYVGTNIEINRLTTALCLQETRNLVAAFLSESAPIRRDQLLEEISHLETNSPEIIVKILANMKPPVETPPQKRGGYYELKRKGFLSEEPYVEYRYIVQLPPEYDPNRSYPTVVTLPSTTTTPEMQIDWWAGDEHDGKRLLGHAARYGYIVISPDWNAARLPDYDFSGMSHAAVLYTLRDAMQRFNIDSDRVFLSGHGIGGTAAWDIAAAHPDLWAGVIPIGGVANRYIRAYVDNMQNVPFYYVGGELEGFGGISKTVLNSQTFNRYLMPIANPCEATVVLYHGRGSEPYSDEILRIFDWMKRHPRNFTPREFAVRTLRHWDDFFWWVELGRLSNNSELSPLLIDPVLWSRDDGKLPKAIQVESKISLNANSIRVKTIPSSRPSRDGDNFVVFLTPDMINFNQKADITVNNVQYAPTGGYVQPSVEVILEDTRTRADRQHPFWARLTR